MIAALALLAQTAAMPPPPPPGMGEPYAPGPYIVFFADGDDQLWEEGPAILARVREDRRILDTLRVRICVAADDPREVKRRTAIARAIRVRGTPQAVFGREGRDCAINGGSRRAPGLLAYQIDIGVVD